jgi:hypothetical protein
MSRFSIALIRLATLALLGSAGTAAYAQQTIDQNKALAGNVTPGDSAGFPITISRPGHYKLMSNLAVPQGTNAIVVTANGVTLDLNGFNVLGSVKCSQYGGEGTTVTCAPMDGSSGILAGAVTGTRILNGSIRGFGTYGVALGYRSIAEQLRIAEIGVYGISGADANVNDVLVELSGAGGISLSGISMVDRSAVRNNGGEGIVAGLIQNSLASGNKKAGMTGRLRGNWSVDNAGPNFSPSSISLGGNVNGNTPF